MKTSVLTLSVLTVLLAACSTPNTPQAKWKIEPYQAVRHGAPSAQSYYQLGRYFQGQHRLDKAEEAYQSALAIDGDHVDVLNALGSLYAERGELGRAAQVFEKLVVLQPAAAYLHNNLGYCYLLQGRMTEAYAEVYKAIVLDETLERGWSNLDQIAMAGNQAQLLAAVKSRQLASLPTDLNARNASAVTAVVAVAPDNVPAPVGTPMATQAAIEVSPSQPMRAVADAGGSDRHVRASEEHFILVSASREIVALDEPIEIGSPVSGPGAVAADIVKATTGGARIEVSNGNGVSRFANRFTAQLKRLSIRVSRITNFDTYVLKTTVVEYQPGYASVAQRLAEEVGPTAEIEPAHRPRQGTDVRVVLGRDALPVKAI